MIDHLRTHRVENDVSCDFEKMALLLYESGLEAPLKDMTTLLVLPIERLRIDAIQIPHATG